MPESAAVSRKSGAEAAPSPSHPEGGWWQAGRLEGPASASASASAAPLLAVLLLALASGCGRHARGPKITEVEGGISAALLTADRATLSRASPTPLHYELSATIMPAGLNEACPSGKVFVSHGAGLAKFSSFDLDCLRDPSRPGCAPPPEGVEGPFWDGSPTVQTDRIPTSPVCSPAGVCTCGPATSAPRLVPDGTDITFARNGRDVLQVFAGMEFAPAAGSCAATRIGAVNFVRRSPDCGRTWTTAVLRGRSFDHQPPFCGNADMPLVYVDPFTPAQTAGSSMAYVIGSSGFNCEGGTNATVLHRSPDGGTSWQALHVFKQRNGRDAMFQSTAMTATPGGSLVAFGCQYQPTTGVNNRDVLIYYSHDNGETFELVPVNAPGAPSVPLCGVQQPSASASNGNFYPSHAYANNTPTGTAARARDAGDAEVVRVAYSSLEPEGAPSRRQVVHVLEVTIPKRGQKAKTDVKLVGTIRPLGPDDSIFRAAFIEPDTLVGGGVPDVSMLYWQEIGQPSQLHTARYILLNGKGPSSEPAFLSLARPLGGGSPRPVAWKLQAPCGTAGGEYRCWAGDYDQGASFYDPQTRTMNFFALWSESHNEIASANAFIHYNVVSVRLP